MFRHQIEITIRRSNMAATIGEDPVDSTVRVDADGHDLSAVWSEALSRLPADVRAAVAAAAAKA